VKIDESRLEKAREEMFERVRRYDERMLTVIKNHLGCEQVLNDLLSAASRRWKRRTCSGKIAIAKDELKLPEIEPAFEPRAPQIEFGADSRPPFPRDFPSW
jgi:hypothetical protein